MENITDYVNTLCYRHKELLQEDCTNTDEFFNLTSELQSVYGLEPDEYGFFTLEQLDKPFVTVCYLEDVQDGEPVVKWSIEKNGQPVGVYNLRVILPSIAEAYLEKQRALEEYREQKTKECQERIKNNSLENRYKDIDPKKKEKTPEEKRKLWAEGMVKRSAKMQAKRSGNYDRFKR